MSAKIQKISKQVRIDADTHKKLKKKSHDEEETMSKLVTRLLKPLLADYEVVSTKST